MNTLGGRFEENRKSGDHYINLNLNWQRDSSLVAKASASSAPFHVLCSDRNQSCAMASRSDEATRISHCDYSVPSFCSEVDGVACCDCSSIISSLSYDSIDGCSAEECMIPTDPSAMEDEEAAPTITSGTSIKPPQVVVNRFISVVSPSNTPFASDNSMLDGSQMDDDTISLMSSTSSLIGLEELRDIQFSPSMLTAREVIPDLNFFDKTPDELICCISSFLDVKSLSRFRCVSKWSRLIASQDESGWRRHCQRLWSQKAFVLKEARLLYRSHNAMSACQLSTYDAKFREELRPEELCFDTDIGEGIVWDFRFKETAGTDWTSFDPWWTGGKARKMVFLRDGSVKQIMQQDDSTKFTLFPPFLDTNQNRQRPPREVDESASPFEMSWRFVEKPMDLPTRPSGSYLRLTVDGRDVPTYVVHRSRTGDWGFVIESCWGVYSSTPLPRRQILNSQQPVRRTRMRLRRTRDGARWLNVDGIETDSEDEGDVAPRRQLHNADSTFHMSPRSQWREALLYNYGAISLPEGEHAAAEFDRVWNQSLRPHRQIS